jgi:hypothetical protein
MRLRSDTCEQCGARAFVDGQCLRCGAKEAAANATAPAAKVPTTLWIIGVVTTLALVFTVAAGGLLGWINPLAMLALLAGFVVLHALKRQRRLK